MAFPKAPKLFEFYQILSDGERLVDYMREVNLLKSDVYCDECDTKMQRSVKRSKSDGEEWRCSACLRVSSIRRGTIFENSKLPLRTQMELLYFFGTDAQIYEVEKYVDVNHKTVIEWYSNLRAECSTFLKEDKMTLGNNDESIIEIDESLFGKKRKYNRGSGRQDQWVFGMVEKGTRKVIFHLVEKRNREVLLPLITDSVHLGSQIHSDCWRAYASLQSEGYLHKTVNHSVEFKGVDGTCTNEIEGLWSLVKLRIKAMKGILHDKIGSILDEFSYRYRYGHSNGDVYHKLLSDLGKQSRIASTKLEK